MRNKDEENRALYTVFIETNFSASHQLHGYQGACQALHGHTWKVRVSVRTDQINDIGISLDFKQLKSLTRSVIDRLDHHHINDLPPFNRENPTAENLARYIYMEMKPLLPPQVSIHEVTVWESDHYAVSYTESVVADGQ